MNSYSTVQIQLNLDVYIYSEGDYIIAYSPQLDIAGQGDSVETAKSSFATLLDIFLEETSRKRTLPAVLLDLGWSLSKTPEATATPAKQYEVPVELLDHCHKSISIPL
jgi:predicted RNase H-like HicB family nuclease